MNLRYIIRLATIALLLQTLSWTAFSQPDYPGPAYGISVASFAEVFYADRSIAEIVFTSEDLDGTTVYAVAQNDEHRTITETVERDYLLFYDLEPHTEYQLYAILPTGDSMHLPSVYVQGGDRFQVEVSLPMFNELSSWVRNPGKDNMIERLAAMPCVTRAERLAVWQAFHWDKRPFRIPAPDEWTIRDHAPFVGDARDVFVVDEEKPSVDSCTCKLVLQMQDYVRPRFGNFSIQEDNANGRRWNINPIETLYNQQQGALGNSPEYGLMQYWKEEGPIKKHNLASYRSKNYNCSYSYYKFWSSMESPSTVFPHYYYQSFNMMCTNYQFEPSSCGCNKTIKLKAEYEANITATANPVSSPCANQSKKGESKVEEYAAVVVTRDGIDSPIYAKAGRAGVTAVSNTVPNTSYMRNWASFATQLNSTINNIITNDTSGADTINFGSLLGSLLTAVYTNQYDTVLGGTKTISPSLVGSTLKTLTLKPNEPIRAWLYSAHSHWVWGYGNWDVSNWTSSSGYLATVMMPQGTTAQCCSKPLARWALGTMPGAPMSQSVVQELVGLHVDIGTNVYPNLPDDPPMGVQIWGEIGRQLGYNVANCPDPADIELRTLGQSTSNSSVPTWQVLNHTGTISLLGNSAGELLQYRVTDLQGRVLAKGATHNESGVFYKPSAELPLGTLLFIQVRSASLTQTFKILL